MSFIVFILILSILILVHEWGHYITARKCGVKVDQFALGFGPKIWSRMHDGTEFCLCAIPLGGYVKMAGDDRTQCTGSREEFLSQPVGHRSLIVVMGPLVNFVLAFVCFWLMFMIGYPDMDLSAKKIGPVIGQVVAGSAAEKAGLMASDKVVSINGKAIENWPDLQDSVTETTGDLTIVVQREGENLQKTLVPQEIVQKDLFGRDHRTRRIGVAPMQPKDAHDVVIVRYGFFESFGRAWQELADITTKTLKALYEMFIGIRSPKEAMGIVGMFFVIKFAISIGFAFVLHIVGIISASLAIFNLLPIIPLDGGHLLLYGIEKLRGKALSAKADRQIAQVGFSLIIVLAVFVFYVDFERIGLIDKIVHFFKPVG